MKNIILLISLLSTTAIANENGDRTNNTSMTTAPISSSMTRMEKKVREAAVKVMIGRGHGSGSIIEYKDVQFIITAHHVINSQNYYVGMPVHLRGINQTKIASLVHADEENDIAVLYLQESEYFKYSKPMQWEPMKNLPDVGTLITYSGFPSHHSKLTFRGRVAGYENAKGGKQVILNVFGWFGSSGSVVYTKKGDIVGVLWGVDIERRPDFQVNEDIVWVSPINNLNIEEVFNVVCELSIEKPSACKK
tara:strand:+ start:2383 stop:3129 length:747 start_codon:yes stop_codon:yes gene_type:complete